MFVPCGKWHARRKATGGDPDVILGNQGAIPAKRTVYKFIFCLLSLIRGFADNAADVKFGDYRDGDINILDGLKCVARLGSFLKIGMTMRVSSAISLIIVDSFTSLLF